LLPFFSFRFFWRSLHFLFLLPFAFTLEETLPDEPPQRCNDWDGNKGACFCWDGVLLGQRLAWNGVMLDEPAFSVGCIVLYCSSCLGTRLVWFFSQKNLFYAWTFHCPLSLSSWSLREKSSRIEVDRYSRTCIYNQAVVYANAQMLSIPLTMTPSYPVERHKLAKNIFRPM
jgi:hypothetical protein